MWGTFGKQSDVRLSNILTEVTTTSLQEDESNFLNLYMRIILNVKRDRMKLASRLTRGHVDKNDMTQANLILDIDKTEPKPARHSYSTTHDNTVSNLDTKPSIKIAKTNTKK